jgi:cytochrome c oxidase cbb3-type subunit 3
MGAEKITIQENSWDLLAFMDSSSFWNDSLAVSLTVSLFVLTIVLIYMGTLYHNIGKSYFPGAYVPRKKKERKQESEVMKALTDVVPIEEEHTILMDHEYDGIRELDNNLPPWWKYGFYFTILWGLVYFAHYHIMELGELSDEEYRSELIQAEKERKAYLETAGDLITADNVQYSVDAVSIAQGESIYTANCKTCHGANAQGDAGPNLTDKYWKNGGDIKSIYTIVNNGKGGMPKWGGRLSAKDIRNVISYVHTLKGTNPANAKEPEGELFEGE